MLLSVCVHVLVCCACGMVVVVYVAVGLRMVAVPVHVRSFLTDFITSLSTNPFTRLSVKCEIVANRRGRGSNCAGLTMGWIDQRKTAPGLVDPLLGFVCQSA